MCSQLRKAEAGSEVVIVDLPGGASALALKAFTVHTSSSYRRNHRCLAMISAAVALRLARAALRNWRAHQ